MNPLLHPIINEYIIKQGFEITEWQLKFDDINIDDADKDSQIYERYLKLGVMSPNEVRKELGLDPYEGGNVYLVPASMVPIGGEEAGNEDNEQEGNEDEDMGEEEKGNRQGNERDIREQAREVYVQGEK